MFTSVHCQLWCWSEKPRHEVQSHSDLCRETGWSIAIESSDELEQVRTGLREMTDARLESFGKAARSLCRDPKCPEVFKRQLEEAKTEWRRRHGTAGLGFGLQARCHRWGVWRILRVSRS